MSPLFVLLKHPPNSGYCRPCTVLMWISLLSGGGLVISPQISARAHHRSSVNISQEKNLLPGNVWFIFFIFACCPSALFIPHCCICKKKKKITPSPEHSSWTKESSGREENQKSCRSILKRSHLNCFHGASNGPFPESFGFISSIHLIATP